MTLLRARPYSERAIRTLSAIAGLALCSCATDTISRAEHAEVLSSLKALRSENGRLEARVEKLEADELVRATRAAQTKTTTTAAAPATTTRVAPSLSPTALDSIPPLAVVKLKPRREAAPSLSTVVEVAEPVAPVAEETDSDEAQAFAEQQFGHGLEMMKTGNSEAGSRELSQFALDWPRHPRADNALYFVGLAAMSDGRPSDAATQFERVLEKYPAGDAVMDSTLKLAECRWKLGQREPARILWKQVIANYPGTTAANSAATFLSKSPAQ